MSKKLKQARAKVSELEGAYNQRMKSLSGLPAQYGFSNADEFIAALKSAARGGSTTGKGQKAKPVVQISKKRGKRARITPEVKSQVKTLVSKGETGAAIAKALGISLPSVQNIKKELGLVRSKKK